MLVCCSLLYYSTLYYKGHRRPAPRVPAPLLGVRGGGAPHPAKEKSTNRQITRV